MTKRNTILSTLVAALIAAAPAAAFAHAYLSTATPAVGSVVHAAPAEVTISFSEGVEPRFSTIVVTDAAGARVDKGDVHLAGADTHLAVSLKPLAAGTYTVTWHATSTDTHKTQGRFTFTVKP
ncbi:MAG TPA: copper homeostasis periplasmic binding protein CopC [Acetobacteraceae bacterium]|nr:copper homeostasis periplasmic binding protein CopC [Acetobacteraceae bacterium]